MSILDDVDWFLNKMEGTFPGYVLRLEFWNNNLTDSEMSSLRILKFLGR